MNTELDCPTAMVRRKSGNAGGSYLGIVSGKRR